MGQESKGGGGHIDCQGKGRVRARLNKTSSTDLPPWMERKTRGHIPRQRQGESKVEQDLLLGNGDHLACPATINRMERKTRGHIDCQGKGRVRARLNKTSSPDLPPC
ncbi:hypothetical protein BY996DRAFT_6540146 [Phakopsora pachyrhizi]|nr:hypothetical protein BY996DRAFT_6540146 [Phakopsora pachyrhizi]